MIKFKADKDAAKLAGEKDKEELASRELQSYVKIRIVTGDHMRTAQAVAKESGILS